MSNYDKIVTRLDSLYRQKRNLDDDIKVCYSKFTEEAIIKHLKQKKLQIKDEIQKLENELKE